MLISTKQKKKKRNNKESHILKGRTNISVQKLTVVKMISWDICLKAYKISKIQELPGAPTRVFFVLNPLGGEAV
jgi:zona occludens toxin (predicted ATPase)